MTDNPQPTEQKAVELKPYLADHFEFAAPGDQQEDVWLLRFCDNDVRDMIWTGDDAEAQAWTAWNRHAPGYNCYVFRLARLAARPFDTRVSALGNLLAVIHRDGGQKIDELGWEGAAQEAERLSVERIGLQDRVAGLVEALELIKSKGAKPGIGVTRDIADQALASFNEGGEVG